MDTLFDTGSPISFVKQSQLPPASIQPSTSLQDYSGINNSKLQTLGLATARVSFDNIVHKIEIFVVPDNTMNVSALLGRDVLNKFNLGFVALPKNEAEGLREIFAIDLETDNVVDSLIINPEVDSEIQFELKNLFFTEYVNKERPKFPNVKIELTLTLTNDKVITFGPRRLSFDEKSRLQKILDNLIARKIIRESNSKYASPIVLTHKKRRT